MDTILKENLHTSNPVLASTVVFNLSRPETDI